MSKERERLLGRARLPGLRMAARDAANLLRYPHGVGVRERYRHCDDSCRGPDTHPGQGTRRPTRAGVESVICLCFGALSN